MSKRSISIIFVTCLALFSIHACSPQGESNRDSGLSAKELYARHCRACHGDDGRKGVAGAKDIPDSKLNLEERIRLIQQGKGAMMPYKGLLTSEEIRGVAEYTMQMK